MTTEESYQTKFLLDYCDIDLEYTGEVSRQGLIDTLGNSLSQDSAKELFPLPNGKTEYSELEKFPTFWGSFCRVGNQVYLDRDGSVCIQNRPEDEVIKSLNSFRNKPVTIGHPGLVFPENAIKDKLARGLTHEDVDYHRGIGRIRITLIDKEAIDAINKDYKQLSAAYIAKVYKVQGDWFGEPFNRQQRDIRGNSIGLVKKGRAGNFAKIHAFDSIDDDGAIQVGNSKYPIAIQLYRQDSQSTNLDNSTIPLTTMTTSTHQEKSTKLTVNGVPLEASETVALAVNNKFQKDESLISSLESENKQLKADKSKWESELQQKAQRITELETENTSLKQQISGVQVKLDAALNPDPVAFQLAVDKRVNLQVSASKILGENTKFAGLSDRQIQELVIAKIHGNELKPTESTPDAGVDYAFQLAVASWKPEVVQSHKNQPQVTETKDSAPSSNSSSNNSSAARQITQDNFNVSRPTDKFIKVGYIEDDDEELYKKQVEQFQANAKAPLGSSRLNH